MADQKYNIVYPDGSKDQKTAASIAKIQKELGGKLKVLGSAEDVNGPVTAEDAESAATPPYQSSVLGALGRGALQGGTAGFADELTGLVGGDKSEQDSRDRNLVTESQHPLAYGAGKAIGSLVPMSLAGLATGGLGAAAIPLAMGATGAAESLGEGQGRSPSEAAVDAAKMFTLDTALGGLGAGAGKALAFIPGAAKLGAMAAKGIAPGIAGPAIDAAIEALTRAGKDVTPAVSERLIQLLPSTQMALEREAAQKAAEVAAQATAKAARRDTAKYIAGNVAGAAVDEATDKSGDLAIPAAAKQAALVEALRRLREEGAR